MAAQNKKSSEGKKQKKCFVVGAIGSDDSLERARSDWLLNGVIRPVAEEKGYAVSRADELAAPGMIDSQVINEVHDSDLVIADLTDHNPNAFYELAIRHMAGKPVIHMIEKTERIPFDVGAFRTLRFSLGTFGDFQNAKDALSQQIEYVRDNPQDIDNPILTARGKLETYQHASNKEKFLLNQIETLNKRLSRIEGERSKAGQMGGKNRLAQIVSDNFHKHIEIVAQFDDSRAVKYIGDIMRERFPELLNYEISGNSVKFTLIDIAEHRAEEVERFLAAHPAQPIVYRM